MSDPVLPFELFCNIIDILGDEEACLGHPTLHDCSLVCLDFLHLCRKHIYASIALLHEDMDDQPTTAPMLQQLLSTTPEIADHIQRLEYCIPPEDFRNPALISTFTKIHYLKKLTIWHEDDEEEGHSRLSWNRNRLRPALLHLMHLPTLTHLELRNIRNFIIPDLMPCVNLERFEFDELAAFNSQNTIVANLPDSSLRISTISAGPKSYSAVARMCATQRADRKPFIDFDCLLNLAVEIYDSEDIRTAQTLFSRCKQLIHVTVDLNVADSETNFSQMALFKMLRPSMNTLTSLSFSFDNIFGIDVPLAGLPSELEEMKNNNVIETITIRMNLHAGWEDYSDEDANDGRGDEWARFDTVLTQSGWPKLQEVSLTIKYWDDDEGTLKDALKDFSRTHFPKLLSNKTLSFKFLAEKLSFDLEELEV